MRGGTESGHDRLRIARQTDLARIWSIWSPLSLMARQGSSKYRNGRKAAQMSSPECLDFAGSVLAVDDCPSMRASLECLGYSVKAVDSGWAALDAAHKAWFDDR